MPVRWYSKEPSEQLEHTINWTRELGSSRHHRIVYLDCASGPDSSWNIKHRPHHHDLAVRRRAIENLHYH